MLERMKRIVEKADSKTSKIKLAGLGLGDEDILVLKELLEKKPHITEVDLTGNNMGRKSGRILSEIGSLKRIHAGQNNLGDEGAEALLSQKNLEFIDLTRNGITVKIRGLLAERGKQGLEIVESNNPKLHPEAIALQEELGLGLSSAKFKTKEPVVPGDGQLSDAVSMAKFGLRRSSEESSSSESLPSDSELKFEENLRQQIRDYAVTHPERCGELLDQIAKDMELVKKLVK